MVVVECWMNWNYETEIFQLSASHGKNLLCASPISNTSLCGSQCCCWMCSLTWLMPGCVVPSPICLLCCLTWLTPACVTAWFCASCCSSPICLLCLSTWSSTTADSPTMLSHSCWRWVAISLSCSSFWNIRTHKKPPKLKTDICIKTSLTRCFQHVQQHFQHWGWHKCLWSAEMLLTLIFLHFFTFMS